ncbi:unnamed protein product, partial [Ixodes hexagonus]
MRFNAKEISAVASQPSYKFEKEGVLFIKERQEGLFRRSDVYTERWCRLRGNLLFYYKSKDQCSDPFGVIVLEQYTVKDGPITGALYCFSLAFGSEDQGLQMAAGCAGERESWMGVLRGASYECVRLQVHMLRSKLHSRQRDSCFSGKCFSSSSKQSHLLSARKGECFDSCRWLLAVADGRVYISACDNLRCDADGQPPNPLVVVMTGRPAQGLWSKFSQTEIVEWASSLPTYHRLCRIHRGCSDFNLFITSEITRLLPPQFFFRVPTLSEVSLGASEKTIGGPLNKAPPLLRMQVERPRTYSLPATLPRRTCTPLHAQLRVAFDGLTSQTYRFHTGLGAELRVHEIMAESKLSFSFPQLLLNLWINEEKQLMETVTQLGEVSLGSDWQNKQLVSLERHLHRISTYSEALENLARHRGSHFKPSAAKGQRSLEFAPVNMHLQRLWVHNTTSRKKCVYDVITVGAFTAYAQKYNQGGLHRMLNQLRNAYPSLQREGQPAILGPDRLSTAVQTILCVEQLKDDVEAEVQRLMQLADLKDSAGMGVVVSKISDKAKQLTTLCHPLLVEEALAIWESARSDQDAVFANGQSATTPAAAGKSLDLGDRRPARLKSASLPRQFPLPAFPSSGGSASPSDDSSSDDSSKDGAVQSADRRDVGSINGSIRSMDIRPMQLQKSDSMYSTDESRFSSLSEEFEPLDLTHLNIRASIMCMVSRVQHLANADGTSAAVASADNGSEDPLPVLTPCSTPGDLSPWAAELMPSIRKLRQSMACLQKVARFTYALLSLKEPPHTASSSYVVRHRRDVCFSHAVS